jgi:hypothetical protein
MVQKKIRWVRKKIKRHQNFLDDAEKKLPIAKTFYLIQKKSKRPPKLFLCVAKKIKRVRKKVKRYQNFLFDTEKKLPIAKTFYLIRKKSCRWQKLFTRYEKKANDPQNFFMRRKKN